jgi:hypothetical protein
MEGGCRVKGVEELIRGQPQILGSTGSPSLPLLALLPLCSLPLCRQAGTARWVSSSWPAWPPGLTVLQVTVRTIIVLSHHPHSAHSHLTL